MVRQFSDNGEYQIKLSDNTDFFNTSHSMIHKYWDDCLNDQIIQSVSVLKEMIGIRDCMCRRMCYLKYG